MEGYVLAGEWPGSGKTTLSHALPMNSASTAWQRMSSRKPSWTNRAHQPRSRNHVNWEGPPSKQRCAPPRDAPAAVTDSTWCRYALPLVRRLPGPFVEIRCRLDVTLAQERFRGATATPAIWTTAARTRNSGYRGHPFRGRSLLEVDTTGRVDVRSLAELVRSALKP